MNNDKRAIIHIGAHKTGSTAIQNFLYDYAEYFYKKGIQYPTEDLTIQKNFLCGQHFIPWYLINYPVKYDLKRGFESFLNLIKEPLDLILSSEEFLRLEKAHITRFIDIFSNEFKEIYIIIYVSPQIRTIPLIYQTFVVSQYYTQNFDYFKQDKLNLFNYYEKVKLWEEEGCKIIVRPYKREIFKNHDINLDFLKLIQKITKREILLPEDYNPQKYYGINLSIPDFMVPIIRYYNSKEKRVIPYLRELGIKLRQYLPDLTTTDFISPSTKKAILEQYKNSNIALCDEYLGKEFIEFLNPEIKETDKEYLDRFGYQGCHLVEMIKAFLKAFDKLEKGGAK